MAKLTKKSKELLVQIVAATLSSQGFMYASEADMKQLIEEELVQVNPTLKDEATGNPAVRASDKGIAEAGPAAQQTEEATEEFLEQEAQTENVSAEDSTAEQSQTGGTDTKIQNAGVSGTASKPRFNFAQSALVASVPVPEVPRKPQPEKYPFAQMTAGTAFFIADLPEKKAFKPVYAAASNATTKNKKAGVKLRFTVAELADGAAFGAEFAGKSGSGCWCVAVTE